MSDFNDLLEQLNNVQVEQQEALAKSLPAEDGKDDKVIQAAAAGDEKNPEDENEEDETKGEEKAEGDKKPMVKAIIDGEEVDAVDATEIIKSLQDRVLGVEETLVKALQTTLNTVKTQGDMIKSLQEKFAKISSQGSGRKTVLSIVEKPEVGGETMVKSEQGITPDAFFAKAQAAFDSNKITGLELTTIDVSLRSGQALPPELIAKTLA